jgi:hypothetical protein
MIILRIIGGLGNQLFIYAFGRSLEIKHDFEVSFDTYSGFKKDTYNRKFELDNFNIKIKKATLSEALYFPIQKRSKTIANILYPGSFYIEDDQNFSVEKLKELVNLHNRIFLQGYFQKAECFESLKEELKNELTLNKELSETADDYLEITKIKNSVAVHIRLKERANLNQLDFYTDNISRLKKELNDPFFFIFSDDINWCKKNMQADSDIIFIENTNNQLEDFWLMKNCKHFIISNSTFAWWGAWLSSNEDKLVVAQNN